MKSSVKAAVAPSVAPATGPGANPAYTVTANSTQTYPDPADTLVGKDAQGNLVQADPSGRPPVWMKSYGGKHTPPPVPRLDGGYTPPTNAAQPGLWVQPDLQIGTVEQIEPRGMANTTFRRKIWQWARVIMFPEGYHEGYNVTTTGFTNRHTTDRQDFWISQGSEDANSMAYWPVTQELPSIAPLAPIQGKTKVYPGVANGMPQTGLNNGRSGMSWTPAPDNSTYTEPEYPQLTSAVTSYDNQGDPAEEYF